MKKTNEACGFIRKPRKGKRNQVFRKWVGEEYPGAKILEPAKLDTAIVGIRKRNVVYDFDILVEVYSTILSDLAENSDDAFQMAMDQVSNDTLMAIQYMGKRAPVVIFHDEENGGYFDANDVSDNPKRVRIKRNCPGLMR